MKRMTIATLVMSLIASSAATAGSIKAAQESAVKRLAAETRDNRHDRRDDHHDRRDERRDDRHDRRDDRRDDRHDRRDDRRDDRWDRRDDRRDDRWDRRDDRHDGRYDRWDDRRDWRRVNAGPYRFPHGYRAHYWRRGDRLPAAYYSRPYVIRDYHSCHLRAPPRGYHYVRVNQDVVLAAIATGLVLEVFRNHFY